MEDTTKGALIGGGIGALVAAVAAFLAYKEGHASGHSSGLAEGVSLGLSTTDQLKRQIAESEKQIQSLCREKEAVLQDLNLRYAYVDSLIELLKSKNIITADSYAAYVNSTARQRNELFLSVADMLIDQSEQAGRILQGQQGRGVVDLSLLKDHHCCCVGIVFTDKVKGVYRWPQIDSAILPEDETILASPKIYAKIKELLPAWDMNAFGRTTNKQGYDYACVCENALQALDRRAVLCDSISYDDDQIRNGYFGARTPTADLNDIVFKRYMGEDLSGSQLAIGTEGAKDIYGVILSSQLDDYLRQSCESVRNAISAFVAVNVDQEKLKQTRAVLQSIARNEPVIGTLEIDDGSALIRFCDDVCVKLPFMNGISPLYFEGDGLSVFSNSDLKSLVAQLVPLWKDRPVSDARVEEKRNQYYVPPERRREYRRLYYRPIWEPGSMQPQPDFKRPAQGATREWLRFYDASEALCYGILQQYVGQRFECEKVTLNRKDGAVLTNGSFAESRALEELLKGAVGTAQKTLSSFAADHNAVLFEDGDLFPLVKSKPYYQKWERLDRIMTASRVRIGDVVTGVVRKIVDFGAFVDLPNGSGLIHISEISERFVKDVHEFLREGQSVNVKIFDIDPKGRLKLSIKRLKA